MLLKSNYYYTLITRIGRRTYKRDFSIPVTQSKFIKTIFHIHLHVAQENTCSKGQDKNSLCKIGLRRKSGKKKDDSL